MNEEDRKITVSTRIKRETRTKAMEIAKARGTTFSKVLGEFIEKSIDMTAESSHDLTDRVIVKMQDSFPQLLDGGNAEELANLIIIKMQDSFPILMEEGLFSSPDTGEAAFLEEVATKEIEQEEPDLKEYPIQIEEYKSDTSAKFNKSIDALIEDFEGKGITLSREEAKALFFGYMVANTDATGYFVFNPILSYYKDNKNKIYGS